MKCHCTVLYKNGGKKILCARGRGVVAGGGGYSGWPPAPPPPKIVAKSLPPPQNLCRPLKTFACVSLRYTKRCGRGVAIVVVVCGEMCGKIEKLLDWNKNWCGSRYDYDSGDKKQKDKKY